MRRNKIQVKSNLFVPQSKFSISNAKQAYQIIDIIKQWFPDLPE